MLGKVKTAFGNLLTALSAVKEREIREKDLEKPLEELELVLIQAGTALEAVDRILDALKKNLVGKKTKEDIRACIRRALADLLAVEGPRILPPRSEPDIILFVGPNGAGKTTTIGKIAYMLKKDGYYPILSASDTFRAGSIQQLEEWAKKVGAKLVKHDYGADPAAVAYDAVMHAKKIPKSCVLIDTAGRQETNTNLMDQLRKIKRVVKPRITVFVGEALAGNALLNQIKGFDEAVGVDTTILTKFDLDVEGGAAFTITAGAGKPIAYVCTGEGVGDIVPFSPDLVLERILPTDF